MSSREQVLVSIGTVAETDRGDCKRVLKDAGIAFNLARIRRTDTPAILAWFASFLLPLPDIGYFPVNVRESDAFEAGRLLVVKGILRDEDGRRVMQWQREYARLQRLWAES